MLPKNFPGRTNERRRVALVAIEGRLASEVTRNNGQERQLTANEIGSLQKQADTLGRGIVAPAQARSIRTKKTPKSTWTAARAAWRSGRLSA